MFSNVLWQNYCMQNCTVHLGKWDKDKDTSLQNLILLFQNVLIIFAFVK
jgi:hypothetical protein